MRNWNLLSLQAIKAKTALPDPGLQVVQVEGCIEVHNPLTLTVRVTLYRQIIGVAGDVQHNAVMVQPGESVKIPVPPGKYRVETSIVKFDQVGKVEDIGKGGFTVTSAAGPFVQKDDQPQDTVEPPIKSLAEMLEDLRNKEVKV